MTPFSPLTPFSPPAAAITAYDPSAAIRLQNTMPSRPTVKNPYDANSVDSYDESEIGNSWSVPITTLQQVRSPNIPHGYPVFIPFWSEVSAAVPLDLTKIESALVSIGPGLASAEFDHAHGVQIERIWLE